jgi:hypothetical protein
MMKIKMSGTYTNVKVLNSPAHTYSISNPAKLVMSKLTIDNCMFFLFNFQRPITNWFHFKLLAINQTASRGARRLATIRKDYAIMDLLSLTEPLMHVLVTGLMPLPPT